MNDDGNDTDDAVVLLSIDPDHAEMLLAGLKRYEYRRVAPDAEPPYTLYLYATDPVQKVVGKVEVINTIDGHPTDVIGLTVHEVPSTYGDLEEYFDGTDEAHALEAADPEEFDGPSRDVLEKNSLSPSQNFRYVGAEGQEVLP